MSTIEIILAVAVVLLLLGTWDNSGRIDRLQLDTWDNSRRIDRLQRRVIAQALPQKAEEAKTEKREVGKNLLGIIEEMEKEIDVKDEEIKELKAELNKVKFDYACEVAGKKEKNTEELDELRTLLFARVIKHRQDMKSKLLGLGASSLSRLKPEHYKRFKDYLLTLESDHV